MAVIKKWNITQVLSYTKLTIFFVGIWLATNYRDFYLVQCFHFKDSFCPPYLSFEGNKFLATEANISLHP